MKKIFAAVKNNDRKAINKFTNFLEIGSLGEITDLELLEKIDTKNNNAVINLSQGIIISSNMYHLFKFIDNSYTLNKIDMTCVPVTVPAEAHTWSNDELDALKALYPIYQTDKIRLVLTDRSVESINKKANAIGLKKIDFNDPSYNKMCKLTRKYLHLEVTDEFSYNLSSVDDMINLISTEYEGKDINCDSPEFELSRFFLKFYSVDDIIKYHSIACPLKLYELLLYSLIYRTDLFDWFLKYDPFVVETMYKGLSYNSEKHTFVKKDLIMTVFNLFICRSESIDSAYNSIKFLLNYVNCDFDEYLTVENFLNYKGIFRKMLIYLSNDKFLDYVKGFIEENDNDGEDYSLIFNTLKEKQSDMKLDNSLNSIYSELLSEFIYNADDDNIEKLFEIRSMIPSPIVIDNDLLQILSLSKYYSKMMNDHSSCVINKNIDIYSILHALVMSAMCGNITFAKVISPYIVDVYKSSPSDMKNKINEILSISVSHFRKNNVKGVEKIFTLS